MNTLLGKLCTIAAAGGFADGLAGSHVRYSHMLLLAQDKW
jgi:hypothetical protein